MVVFFVSSGQLKIVGDIRERWNLHVGGTVAEHDFLLCEGLHVPILGFKFLSDMNAILELKECSCLPSGKVRYDGALITGVSQDTTFLANFGWAGLVRVKYN